MTVVMDSMSGNVWLDVPAVSEPFAQRAQEMAKDAGGIDAFLARVRGARERRRRTRAQGRTGP